MAAAGSILAIRRPAGSLLLQLAAELRNDIWQLAFTSTTPRRHYLRAHGDVDLFHARNPSSDLLRTCRQIYSEALQYWLEACDRYWRETHFYLDCKVGADLQLHGLFHGCLRGISNENVAKINNLAICHTSIDWDLPVCTLHQGIWQHTYCSNDPPRTISKMYTVMLTPEYAYRCRQAGWRIQLRDPAALALRRTWCPNVRIMGCRYSTGILDLCVLEECSEASLTICKAIKTEMGHEKLTKEEIWRAVL